MNARVTELAAIGAGLAYLGLLGWAVSNLSFDIWGALVVGPVYGVLGSMLIHRTFRGSLTPVATALYWGLLFKFGGAAARYWVGFEAYGGGIDAGRYHSYALDAAGKVWSGDASFFTVIPSGTGTIFVDRLTAFIYVFTGGSQLAGFVTFAFFAFVGIIFIVKAAVIAVPGLAQRRYAWFCALFPSIVYWPSSIGKEALMMLGLGIATYGIAALLAYGRWLSSLLIIGCGLGFAAFIRPHIAGIWVAASLPALVVAVVLKNRVVNSSSSARSSNKFALLAVLVIAGGAVVLIGASTIRFLAPPSNEELGTGGSITLIFEETARRTSQAGSNISPPSLSNPISWPYAVARTLTRPLPFEARGVAQLVSAAEMTALLGIFFVSRRRLANLPRLFVQNPYVTFVVVVLFLAGLAYSSLGNLGILTRQKSLVMPFLVLLACVPERTVSKPKESRLSVAQQSSVATALAPPAGGVKLAVADDDPNDAFAGPQVSSVGAAPDALPPDIWR